MLSFSEYTPRPPDDNKKLKHCIALDDSEACLDGISYYYDKEKDIVYEWNVFTKHINEADDETRERLLIENKEKIKNSVSKS